MEKKTLIAVGLLATMVYDTLGKESSCPTILSRSDWDAEASKSIVLLKSQPVQYAFIHHSGTPECYTRDACAKAVKGFQDYHMKTKKWDDISYSFVIGGDGSVFEGRGWDRVGAHTKGYNDVGLGFCLIGNFQNRNATTIQMEKTKALLECGEELGKLKKTYTLRGHRDMKSSICPGDELYRVIKTWSHY